MSPWLRSVVDRLQKGLGTAEQKQRAATAALAVDAVPDGKMRHGLTAMFDAWLGRYGYVQNEHADDYDLPDTVMQPEGDDDAVERGRTKGDWREWRRGKRVDRALLHLNAGWSRLDVKCFISSREELADAWAQFAAQPFGRDEPGC